MAVFLLFVLIASLVIGYVHIHDHDYGKIVLNANQMYEKNELPCIRTLIFYAHVDYKTADLKN